MNLLLVPFMFLKDSSLRVLLFCPSSKTNIKFQVILPIEMTQNGSVSSLLNLLKFRVIRRSGAVLRSAKYPLTLDLV